ncbi:hypothetical protein TrCOL_g10574 [Triparma columacea]|uniref:LOV domain-containing protein n=1 Tax=Triparma columacea TaxID=722753 RepID=A0A9W7L941_9STRA|nr:hypothetical protein TrCOL_g10574 [Triparma columacea]
MADNVAPPMFRSAGGGSGNASGIDIDDIFSDAFFSPQGDMIFLDQRQGGPGSAVVSTEGIPNQRSSQLGFVAPINSAPPQTTTSSTGSGSGRGKKRSRPQERKMSEQQRVERRERNREHAKRSRIRKKFLLESLQQTVALLREENDKLRNAITTHLGSVPEAGGPPSPSGDVHPSLLSDSPMAGDKVLDDPDFSFIKALQTAQQNFVVTDPSLPDNPIVYATQGFLDLTGYTLPQVLGRNCRFLQGPDTDPRAVEKIRVSIEKGDDMSVCLLNYRADGTRFWNQFFIAALRDASGCITNYVGVQCKVSETYARNVCEVQMGEGEEGGGKGFGGKAPHANKIGTPIFLHNSEPNLRPVSDSSASCDVSIVVVIGDDNSFEEVEVGEGYVKVTEPILLPNEEEDTVIRSWLVDEIGP